MSIEFIRPDGTRSSTSVSHYPGGEPLLKIESAADIAFVRGARADDLIVLALWANSVRRLGGRPVAFIPYLPGARADHTEHKVGFDALAYAELINAARLDRVVCVDPHSLVMPRLIKRCMTISATDLILQNVPEKLAGIIVPDRGAVLRATRVAEQLGLPLFQGRKERDFESGELSGFTCEPLPDSGEFLVVDDICDGGGTFRGLAAATGVGYERLHLWVTHGIFSNQAPANLKSYRTITTTDSHPGHLNIITNRIRIIKLLPYLLQHL